MYIACNVGLFMFFSHKVHVVAVQGASQFAPRRRDQINSDPVIIL